MAVTMSYFGTLLIVLCSFEISTIQSLTALCPEDWKLFNKHCYYISDNDDHYHSEAKYYCETHYNSTLVSVSSEKEHLFLYDHLGSYDMWIGLYKKSGETETFQWSDGSELGYTKWYKEPKYSISASYCVKMTRDYYGRWDDTDCTGTNRFACEIPYTPAGTSSCSSTQFDCLNGQCLPSSWECDNHNDCTNGNDEKNCDHSSSISNSVCPEDWKLFDKHCYYISDSDDHYQSEAAYYCETHHNSTLVSVSSEEEHLFLYNQHGSKDLWIGLFKKSGENETFQWTDGSELGYTKWYHSQPSYTGSSSYCVKMYQSFLGRWIDTSCTNTNRFACEIPYIPAGTSSCSSTQFDCLNGQCLPSSWECDNHNDCTNGNDENNCEITSSPISNSVCPEEWILFDKHCYYISDSNDHYQSEAAYFCETHYNSTLVSVNSEEEQLFLFDQHGSKDLWIGLYKKSGENETFQWTDGSELGYTKWYSSQLSYTGSSPYCVEMRCNNNGRWGNVPCTYRNRFACEIPYIPAGTSSCSSSQFDCQNGQCLPSSWECDNHNDCTNGNDEKNCEVNSSPVASCEYNSLENSK